MGFVLFQASSKDSRAWIRTHWVIIIEIAIALKIDPLPFVSVYQYVANHLSSFKKYRRHINAINRSVSGNLTTCQFCNGNKDVNRGTELYTSKLCLITLSLCVYTITSFVLPGLIFPGIQAMAGSLIPPSYVVPFPHFSRPWLPPRT